MCNRAGHDCNASQKKEGKKTKGKKSKVWVPKEIEYELIQPVEEVHDEQEWNIPRKTATATKHADAGPSSVVTISNQFDILPGGIQGPVDKGKGIMVEGGLRTCAGTRRLYYPRKL